MIRLVSILKNVLIQYIEMACGLRCTNTTLGVKYYRCFAKCTTKSSRVSEVVVDIPISSNMRLDFVKGR